MKILKGVISGLLICVAVSLAFAFPVSAAVDWTNLQDLRLQAPPLDLVSSEDGKLVFILLPHEVLVYSPPEGKITGRIPLKGAFDRLSFSPRTSALILSSNSEKRLKILRIDPVYEIEISGRPFRGPRDAPVTIVVFSDYQ